MNSTYIGMIITENMGAESAYDLLVWAKDTLQSQTFIMKM